MVRWRWLLDESAFKVSDAYSWELVLPTNQVTEVLPCVLLLLLLLLLSLEKVRLQVHCVAPLLDVVAKSDLAGPSREVFVRAVAFGARHGGCLASAHEDWALECRASLFSAVG